jgi:hypothetical protein
MNLYPHISHVPFESSLGSRNNDLAIIINYDKTPIKEVSIHYVPSKYCDPKDYSNVVAVLKLKPKKK